MLERNDDLRGSSLLRTNESGIPRVDPVPARTGYTPDRDTLSIIDDVMLWGHPMESRYGPGIEILGGTWTFQSGRLVSKRGMNLSLGWMELLQLIAGVYDIDAIKRVAPKANHSLFTYKMAYGPRIFAAVPSILAALRNDPNTRQAVLFVASPYDGPTSDQPCTTTIQFLIRQGKIYAVVSMRSWDLVRGLPYDIMMFSGLLEVFGRCLGIPAGDVTVNAGSAHIYNDFLKKDDDIPIMSKNHWSFLNGPTTWGAFCDWADHGVRTLQKGGVPWGIVIEAYPKSEEWS